jgi:hypothetical protein
MIDQELIEQNIKHAKQAFSKLQPTASTSLWRLENVLTQPMLDKLKKYAIDTPGLNIWKEVDGQEDLNRRQIAWHQDTVIEEIHMVFEGLTDVVNAMFSENRKNFLGIALWKDWAGYTMDWHVDNTIIDISIQLYLFDTAPKEAGTVFKINGADFLIPYVSNSGYLCVQTENESLLHKPAIEITDQTVRYSLYSVWSNTAKKVADT